MRYVLQAAVLMLMISVGMSLKPRQLVENWRLLTPSVWLRLLVATFLVPPALALALGHLVPLEPSFMMGLFLIAVVPGAPLMTRGAAAKGFDMQVAASYQMWGAILTPILVPLIVAGCAALYGRDIWIPPMQLLSVIVRQQFLPFAFGMLLMWRFPEFSRWAQRVLNPVGNLLLAVAIVAVLYTLGPGLATVNVRVLLAAPTLAVGCLLAVLLMSRKVTSKVKTLAICNANRHVGLAILLAGQDIRDERPIPAIAVYALSAIVVMAVYAKLAQRETQQPLPQNRSR